MIKNSTALVLGAGASIPYGFPTGFALLKFVSEQLKGQDFPFFRLLREAGEPHDAVREFGEVLWRSGQGSIDAFLENRTDFLTLGKKAIAAALIPCESEPRLFPDDTGEDWLRYIAHFVMKTRDTFEACRLSIITFNYDRSVEYFLFTALRNSYGLTEDEAARLMGRVCVIHLHGRLGPPHWENARNTPEYAPFARAYNPESSAERVVRCAEQIKIIHEADPQGDAEFDRARQILASADRVVFLGFGYHERNVARLKIPIHSPNLQLFGSTYGMKGGELETAMGLLGNRVSRKTIDTSLGNREFLRTLPLAAW
jgi:hypothetical protein